MTKMGQQWIIARKPVVGNCAPPVWYIMEQIGECERAELEKELEEGGWLIRPFLSTDDLAKNNPIAAINRDIDRLMARLPTLPAWAAHQIAGYKWAAKGQTESAETYLEEAQAENEYSHRDEAHR